MEIIGKVIEILNPQEGISQSTGNPWKIQAFILETLDQYPRKVCIEIFGEDKIKKNLPYLDQIVKAQYDLESREFNGRWYTSVKAWKVEENREQEDDHAPQAPRAPQAPTAPSAPAPNTETFDPSEQGTDLPF